MRVRGVRNIGHLDDADPQYTYCRRPAFAIIDPSTRYYLSEILHLRRSSRVTDFVMPGVDDWLMINVVDEGHQALQAAVSFET